MPRLTAKACAEILDRPAHDQLRILREQKYPRREPQIFMTPYYHPALTGIGTYFRRGNDPAALEAARAKIEQVNPEARRRHNRRVLDSFETSDSYLRSLDVRPDRNFSVELGTVEIRLSADLLVHDAGRPKVLFVNCRVEALEEDFGRRILEIAHWVLAENDAGLAPRDVELIDLASGRTRVGARPRKSTIRKVRDNVQIIETLWESI